jgi:hypothetical protein
MGGGWGIYIHTYILYIHKLEPPTLHSSVLPQDGHTSFPARRGKNDVFLLIRSSSNRHLHLNSIERLICIKHRNLLFVKMYNFLTLYSWGYSSVVEQSAAV